MGAEQLVEGLTGRLAKRSIPSNEPWLLRMAEILDVVHHRVQAIPD